MAIETTSRAPAGPSQRPGMSYTAFGSGSGASRAEHPPLDRPAGHCCDSAVTERLLATLECEMLDRATSPPAPRPKIACLDFSEGFYNTANWPLRPRQCSAQPPRTTTTPRQTRYPIAATARPDAVYEGSTSVAAHSTPTDTRFPCPKHDPVDVARALRTALRYNSNGQQRGAPFHCRGSPSMWGGV